MGDERENQSILITSVDSWPPVGISTDIFVAVNPVPVKLRARRKLFHTLLQSPQTHILPQRHRVILIPRLYHHLHRLALCRPSVCPALLP